MTCAANSELSRKPESHVRSASCAASLRVESNFACKGHLLRLTESRSDVDSDRDSSVTAIPTPVSLRGDVVGSGQYFLNRALDFVGRPDIALPQLHQPALRADQCRAQIV